MATKIYELATKICLLVASWLPNEKVNFEPWVEGLNHKPLNYMILLYGILERSTVVLFWQMCKLISYLGLLQVKKHLRNWHLVSRWVNSKFLVQFSRGGDCPFQWNIRETGKFFLKLLQVFDAGCCGIDINHLNNLQDWK